MGLLDSNNDTYAAPGESSNTSPGGGQGQVGSSYTGGMPTNSNTGINLADPRVKADAYVAAQTVARHSPEYMTAMMNNIAARGVMTADYLRQRGAVLAGQIAATGASSLDQWVSQTMRAMDANKQVGSQNAIGYGGINKFAPTVTRDQITGLPEYGAKQQGLDAQVQGQQQQTTVEAQHALDASQADIQDFVTATNDGDDYAARQTAERNRVGEAEAYQKQVYDTSVAGQQSGGGGGKSSGGGGGDKSSDGAYHAGYAFATPWNNINLNGGRTTPNNSYQDAMGVAMGNRPQYAEGGDTGEAVPTYEHMLGERVLAWMKQNGGMSNG